MTPHEYMQAYRELKVPIVGDDDKVQSFKTVEVHKYLLNQDDNVSKSTNAFDTLLGKLRDHFAKPKATLTVFVGAAGAEKKVFESWNDAWSFGRKAYLGKACPEEIQITLQLVVRFKMETADNLQTYCDKATDGLAQGRVGLDCNGFVGNYIDHGLRGKAWDDAKLGGGKFTADQGIATIMRGLGPEVKSLDDLKNFQMYVMGLVDPSNGQVIDRFAGKLTGHIVVTSGMNTVGLPNIAHDVMQAIESTHDVGLTESNYELLSGKNFLFEVRRGSKLGTPYEKETFRLRELNS